MKLVLTTVALLACGAAALHAAQESSGAPTPPPPTEPGENHEWLAQLVGEWRTDYECPTGPDSEPMRMQGTQSVHAIGGLWFVTEGEVEFGGESIANRMTLGYDPRAEAFVGTWVDAMHAHMWVYRGSLDAEREVLTLETEGPSMTDPSRDAKYRETIEFEGPDRYVFTSEVQGPDGDWTLMVRAESQRVE